MLACDRDPTRAARHRMLVPAARSPGPRRQWHKRSDGRARGDNERQIEERATAIDADERKARELLPADC